MVTVLSHVSARTRPGRPEMIQAAGTRPAELVGGREEVSDQSPLLLKLSAIYTGASPQGQTPGGDTARQPPAMALGRQLAAAAKHSCKKQILSFPSHKYLPWARLLDTDGRCRCSALCRILHLARCYQQINKSPQSSHEEGDSIVSAVCTASQLQMHRHKASAL